MPLSRAAGTQHLSRRNAIKGTPPFSLATSDFSAIVSFIGNAGYVLAAAPGPFTMRALQS
jgi:hypothetical protein